MTKKLKIVFAEPAKHAVGDLVLMAGWKAVLGQYAREVDGDRKGLLKRVMEEASFKGKARSLVEAWLEGPGGAQRLFLLGLGEAEQLCPEIWLKAGALVAGRLERGKGDRPVAIVLEKPMEGGDKWASAEEVVFFAQGLEFGSYRFDKYKTEEGEAWDGRETEVRLLSPYSGEAERIYRPLSSVMDGVAFARNLVNEPANHLGTLEFAERVRALGDLGVQVEILTEREMSGLGMGALLAVAQGSVRPPRLAIMRWDGDEHARRRVAVVGKGVVFDSGGISLKPPAGMEEMKGDMGGAAAVSGLMKALALRKARANVVGIIGLVENMPGGAAQRPGDVVTTMSGKTVEVLNTDAEGRLVLADALWYARDRFAPSCIIDLATLTGAVVVALGSCRAGLFTNDDDLARQLIAAGELTGERVWRLPLGPEYDQLIRSDVADMKNIGGREAGAVVAAQFLQRYVGDTPWAHLDIAGTSMKRRGAGDGVAHASGFGVRLLDRWIASQFEQ